MSLHYIFIHVIPFSVIALGLIVSMFLFKKRDKLLNEAYKTNFNRQAFINILEKTSLPDITQNQIFDITISEISILPSIPVDSKIAIYSKDAQNDFVLASNINFTLEMCEAMAKLTLNDCLCSQLQKPIKSYYNFDNHYLEKYSKFFNYLGHYCVPIVSNQVTYAIIMIYISDRFKKEEFEPLFFNSIALSIANILVKKNIEKELKDYATQQRLINKKLLETNLDIGNKNIEMQTLTESVQQVIDKILVQQLELEETYQDITDSINYAKTIQDALIPTEKIIKKILWKYFILSKAKNTVSGDFYYVAQRNEMLYLSVADCTGHGIAGAFLSILGISFIQDIVKWREAGSSAEVLNTLRKRIKRIFVDSGSNSRNGMDMAFCMINVKTNILQYSGAFNSMYIIRNDELTELQPTRNPIGFYIKEKDFTDTEFQLESGDKIYMFSDGYFDQFGATDRKKFSKKRFKELLIEINHKPMNEQHAILEKAFEDWRGPINQVDDVTVLGFEWK